MCLKKRNLQGWKVAKSPPRKGCKIPMNIVWDTHWTIQGACVPRGTLGETSWDHLSDTSAK